jgi:hypothetical protein
MRIWVPKEEEWLTGKLVRGCATSLHVCAL